MEQFKLEETFKNYNNVLDKISNDSYGISIINKIVDIIKLRAGEELSDKSIKRIANKIAVILLPSTGAIDLASIAIPVGMIVTKDPSKFMSYGLVVLRLLDGVVLYFEDGSVRSKFRINRELLIELSKFHAEWPMVSVPKDWDSNDNGGYYLHSKNCVLGSRFTLTNTPKCLSVLNTLQKIPWEIDQNAYDRLTPLNTYRKSVKVLAGKPFYFVWKYDSRGRSYSVGYPVNLQSNDESKSLLSLYNTEIVQDYDSLYIAIANHAGKDKLTWNERIQWTRDNLQEVVNDNVDWDEPALGNKAATALLDTIDGYPTGYWMTLDATSSGIQIMGILSGCKQTALLTNCVDPNKRYDLYQEVTDKMNDILGTEHTNVTRKVIKKCVMTFYYNSIATPKKLLSKVQFKTFTTVLTGLLPGPEQVMGLINEYWNPKNDEHSWVLPDGHEVVVPVVESVAYQYRDDTLGDILYTTHEQTGSDNFRSLCPNVNNCVIA